jgi:cysteine-rich repeat protein
LLDRRLATEECDDGNGAADDGCSPGCAVEPGWVCSGQPSSCVPLCGDTLVVGAEQCDDGNTLAGDCCSPGCLFDASGTPCAGDGNPCTDDVCDGAGGCAHPENTQACDDGDLCTVGDACAGGACAGSPVVCPTCAACDPGSGACVAAPRPACKLPTESFRARLLLRQEATDRRDLISWKWLPGAQTEFVELGTPQTADDYELCVFDATPAVLLAARAPAGGQCGRDACWTRLGSRGFKYRDPELTPAGLPRMVVKAGAAGRARVTLVGRGEPLQDPRCRSARSR